VTAVRPEEGMAERLSKLIARRGVASRREAERLIDAGEVTVNGEIVTSCVPADGEVDLIRVRGRQLPPEPPKMYFLLYKPRGVIVGREDPQGRKSVFDLGHDFPVRVEPVGRLDFDTEGALLLTNDGDLANVLTHPRNHVPKRYMVKVYRTPDERDLGIIRRGIQLDDGKTAPAKVRLTEATDKQNAWMEITVTEGRNRLIRRMMASLGHPVSKLRRMSFATISLRGLERGDMRQLSRAEVKRLQEIGAGVKPTRAGQKKGKGFAKAKPKPVRPGAKKRRGPKLSGSKRRA
jgi:23S rRNA pseudouridine2605 synthase